MYRKFDILIKDLIFGLELSADKTNGIFSLGAFFDADWSTEPHGFSFSVNIGFYSLWLSLEWERP